MPSGAEVLPRSQVVSHLEEVFTKSPSGWHPSAVVLLIQVELLHYRGFLKVLRLKDSSNRPEVNYARETGFQTSTIRPPLLSLSLDTPLHFGGSRPIVFGLLLGGDRAY